MITVKVAPALETTQPLTSLDFNVYYDGQLFTVTIKVPPEKYNMAVQQARGLYAEYPGIDPSVLERAYYLQLHARNPNDYPLSGITILKDGKPITDEEVEKEILADLLTYCIELFPALSQSALNSYRNYGEEWRKLYDDAGLVVGVSDVVSNTMYVGTLLAPLFDIVDSCRTSHEELRYSEWRS